MEEITRKIALYHNLFLGCLAVCILCLIIAIVIFFVLDIRNVLGYLTGRKAKKQIQEMEAANAMSGRLMPRERSNMQYVAQEMKEDMGVRSAVTPGARKVEHAVQEGTLPGMTGQTFRKTDPQNVSGEDATSLLQENRGEQETSVLQQTGEQETSILQASEAPQSADINTAEQTPIQEPIPDDSTAALQQADRKVGTFRIEREIILIHAEEVI